MRKLIPVALTVLSAIIPASAGTITLLDAIDPNGGITTALGGTSVNLTNGTSADGLSWSNTGASVANSTPIDVQLYGTFSCASLCNDTFGLDFTGTGFSPGTTVNIQLFGTAPLNTFVDGYVIPLGTNTTVLSVFNNVSGAFLLNSPTLTLPVGGTFSGTFYFNLQMGAGTLSIPPNSTADVFITDVASVPEPATIAIAAACILLLVYVKRPRKA